jgi:hypothetical protein
MRGGSLGLVPVLVPLWLAGCAGHAGPGTSPTSARDEAYLVFTSDAAGGHARTRWIVPDARAGYRVIAERAELVVADGAHLWAWRTHRHKVPHCDCDCFMKADGGGPGASPAVAVCVRPVEVEESQLVELTGAASPFALPAGAPFAVGGTCDFGEDGAGVTPDDCRSTPLGAVGPFLFVYSACFQYMCGAAHGDMSADFHVLDLRTRSPAELVTTAELADYVRLAPARNDLTLTAPDFGAGGALRLILQFTVDSSYAESDGRWNSYTTSWRTLAPTLPAALRGDETATPPPVARWLAAQQLPAWISESPPVLRDPDDEVGGDEPGEGVAEANAARPLVGWTRVTGPAAMAAALAAFR